MFTTIGKELRNISLNRGELLYDMAKKLGISSSDLSSIENGQVYISIDFVRKVINTYDLNSAERSGLIDAFGNTRRCKIRKYAFNSSYDRITSCIDEESHEKREPNVIYYGADINVNVLVDQMTEEGYEYWLMDSVRIDTTNRYIIWSSEHVSDNNCVKRWGLRKMNDVPIEDVTSKLNTFLTFRQPISASEQMLLWYKIPNRTILDNAETLVVKKDNEYVVVKMRGRSFELFDVNEALSKTYIIINLFNIRDTIFKLGPGNDQCINVCYDYDAPDNERNNINEN